MKLKVFILFHFFLIFKLTAQTEALNFNWVTALIPLDRYTESKVLALTTDSVKNVYTFGVREGDFTYSTPGYDSLILSPIPKQYFLSKQDKYGKIVWYRDLPISVFQATVEVKEMVTDDMGGIYLVGNYRGKVDFSYDPNVLDTIKSMYNNYDIFLCKYDTSASFIYCKTIGGPFDDMVYSACFDKSMNSYIAGTCVDECDFDPSPQTYTISPDSFSVITSFLSKYDSGGNLVFAKPIAKLKNHNGVFMPGKLTYNSSRNILNLTAMFRDSIEFNYLNYTSYLNSKSYAACIFMYSHSGDLLFFKKTVSGFRFSVKSIICESDSNKNIYTLYNFNSQDTLTYCSQVFFSSKPTVRNSCLLIKTDSLGNCIWSHIIGREYKSNVFTTGFYLDKEGNSVLYGYYMDTVSFNNLNTDNYLYSQYYIANTFLVKYNSDDSLLFVNNLIDGDVENIYATPNRLHVNKNDVYVTGTYYPNIDPYKKADFDISANILEPNFTAITDNGYLVKYNICGAGRMFATSNPSFVCIGNASTLSYSIFPATNSYTWSNSCSFPTCVVSPTVNTSYEISSTFSNGCVGTYPVNVFVKNCVGEIEYNLNEIYFDIYPNPANQMINISSTKDLDLTIVNGIGEVVKSFSVKKEVVQKINLDIFESGVYYVIPKGTLRGGSRKMVVIK